uniref:Uncharacterized protein n=1 Tax=Steinernema glaseri TaxID=37863 RepID=A0A1I7ZMM9_9BILA
MTSEKGDRRYKKPETDCSSVDSIAQCFFQDSEEGEEDKGVEGIREDVESACKLPLIISVAKASEKELPGKNPNDVVFVKRISSNKPI